MGRDYTKNYAKNQICLFFTREWPEADAEELELEKIADGYSNIVHIVRRKNPAITEPAVVILRHYGGNDMDLTSWATKNTEAEETMIVQEMSVRGWGPKLYGIFPGGRVEEYIDSRSLAPQDLQDDNSISREIARNYARFHSIRIPLQKGKMDQFRDKVVLFQPERVQKLKQEIKEKRPDLLPGLLLFLDWNTAEDKRWLFQVLENEQFRQGFSIVDTNYLNILLRHNRNEGTSFTVLVDYELAAYGYCALDIGGHLMMRVLQARGTEDMLSGLEFPSMDQIRDFVTAYADECRRLGTLRAEDTCDHLVREALFGSLLFMIYFAESAQGNLDMISAEVKVISAFAKFRSVYDEVKEILLQGITDTAP